MKRLLLLLLLLQPVLALPLQVTVLNDPIPALPGTKVVIPFEIHNAGETALINVTVYVLGPKEGFRYERLVIGTPIGPGETYRGTVTVEVLNVPPGRYNMTLVAGTGDYYAMDRFVLEVGSLVDYDLWVSAKERYVYGQNVTVVLYILSRSNTIISGRVGYSVGPINVTEVTYIAEGSLWHRKLELDLEPGNYTLLFWANLSGVYRSTSVEFEVYRRPLDYRVYFSNGAIRVLVTNSTGGVPGIKVEINGDVLFTGRDGTAVYPVIVPGLYRVVLHLDGVTVEHRLVVERLSISSVQRGELLLVTVTANGTAVPNATVMATGPEGTDYGVTNATGAVVFDLDKIGYGSVFIKAESERYLPGEAVITVEPPRRETGTTTTATTTTPVPVREEGLPLWPLAIPILGVSLYLAFFRPVIVEETLDRYYFLKVRAPRARPFKGTIERPVLAVSARATAGKVKLDDGKLTWELELEPGEEAFLQARLG